MLGKNDLVDNLSRDLDRARGKRDALASDVTTLTAQIAEIEARLSEEKSRRERDRVLGEIEAIKKRIKQTASAFAPVIGELCEATEMAAAVVPEARELNSFLLSVATEVGTVIDPLLRELDRRADAVRAGHIAPDFPCLANEAPAALPEDNHDRRLGFPRWLARPPAWVERARHRLLNIAMIRYCGSGMIGLCGKPASIPNCSSTRASRPTAIVGPSLVSGRVFPRDPKESRSVLRSRVKVLRPRAALTVDFLTSRRSGLLPALGNGLLWFLRRLSWPCGAGRPGHRDRFPRSNCAQEGSGRTDRGPAEPHGAHIPVALRGGGPSGGAAESLIAAAAHYARSGRRCGGCRCSACRRVP
jgi:hypothetical protein